MRAVFSHTKHTCNALVENDAERVARCVVRHTARHARFPNVCAAAVLSIALVAGLFFPATTMTAVFGANACGASVAHADEVDEAQAALDEAEARMATIAQEYAAIQAEADSLQAHIDATAQEALAAQDAVLEGRRALGQSVVYEYRGGSTSLALELIFSSTSFDDFLRNIFYLNSITQYQADEVSAQKERVSEFQSLLSELNVQKSDYDSKVFELEQKQAEAEQVIEVARARLDSAQVEQAARLAALEQQRAEMAGASGSSDGNGEGSSSGSSTTVDREEVVPPSTPVTPDPNPTPPSDDGSGWQSGAASAYGGSTDPYTPNPGRTATGDVCDDNSMGVAIPMSWPNYRSYYGRTVEISYNGMTVLATVNDCGGLLGGARSLDLQPGVWKAFGFSSCSDWGVRTVSYRFL